MSAAVASHEPAPVVQQDCASIAIPQAEADAWVQSSTWSEQVEDYEQLPNGDHVYTLGDGSTVSLLAADEAMTWDWILCDPDGELLQQGFFED